MCRYAGHYLNNFSKYTFLFLKRSVSDARLLHSSRQVPVSQFLYRGFPHLWSVEIVTGIHRHVPVLYVLYILYIILFIYCLLTIIIYNN